MLPDPLHPAVVHFPVALSVLAPLLALLALVAIRAGWIAPRVWLVVVGAQLLLVISGWVALETGEDQEERVERVVREHYIDEHAEAAEWFLWLAGGTAAISALGLLAGRAGGYGRAATLVAGAVVLAAAIRTGHLGGELVYEHGAASAYVEKPTKGKAAATAPAPETGRDADD